MPRLTSLSAPCAVLSLFAGVSQAERVTFEYFGEVSAVTQAPDRFVDAQVGDAFSFIFTFDPTVPNTARQDSTEFTRGLYVDLIEKARLAVGGAEVDLTPDGSSISITDHPGAVDDFFQVFVELDSRESFLFELEDGPGLTSADLPTEPPLVSAFGPGNGGEYTIERGFADFVNAIDFAVLGQRLRDPDLLFDDGGAPDPVGGNPDPIVDDPAPTVVPTPAAALLGFPILCGLALRRRHRSSHAR